MVLTVGVSKQHYTSMSECEASDCVKKFKGKCNSSVSTGQPEFYYEYYCQIDCFNMNDIYDSEAQCVATGCISLGLMCLETSIKGKYQCQNTSVGP